MICWRICIRYERDGRDSERRGKEASGAGARDVAGCGGDLPVHADADDDQCVCGVAGEVWRRAAGSMACWRLCTLLAAGVFGLLRLRRWGWALVLGGCLTLCSGESVCVSEDACGAVPGAGTVCAGVFSVPGADGSAGPAAMSLYLGMAAMVGC